MRLPWQTFLFHIVATVLMLVHVVAEMLCGRSFLMLAIRARRRPSSLERECKEQKNEEEFFHYFNSVVAIVFDGNENTINLVSQWIYDAPRCGLTCWDVFPLNRVMSRLFIADRALSEDR